MTPAQYQQQQFERSSKQNELLGRAFAILTDPLCDNEHARSKWIKDYNEFYRGPDDRATQQPAE